MTVGSKYRACPPARLPACPRNSAPKASPNMLRKPLGTFIKTLLSAEATRSAGPNTAPAPRIGSTVATATDTVTSTPAPAPSTAIPKLREGSNFPEWLLERRKRHLRVTLPVRVSTHPPASPGRQGLTHQTRNDQP